MSRETREARAKALLDELLDAIGKMRFERGLEPRLIVLSVDGYMTLLSSADGAILQHINTPDKTLLGYPWAEAERPMQRPFNLLPVGKQTCECWGTGEQVGAKPCWRCEGRGWRL